MKPKEFFSRWKGGIEAITPLQQLKVNIIGTILVLIGIMIGVVTTFITKTWWLFIVLVGSLFVSGIGFLGTMQRYIALKRIDDMMKEQITLVDGKEGIGMSDMASKLEEDKNGK